MHIWMWLPTLVFDIGILYHFVYRYKGILESILKTGGNEMVPSLQAFVEACMYTREPNNYICCLGVGWWILWMYMYFHLQWFVFFMTMQVLFNINCLTSWSQAYYGLVFYCLQNCSKNKNLVWQWKWFV